MDVTVASPPWSAGAGFGPLLRAWRSARGQSQLALSMTTGVSSRHLSYLETGRANPSRDMVLTLSVALDIPLRERNVLLEAAGFAAVYRETPLDAPALGAVRDAIRVMLGAAGSNPTFVVNRRYDVLDASAAGRWLLETFTEDLERFAEPYNMARLLVAPAGFRPHMENWDEVARKVLGRLRRELGGAHARDRIDDGLLEEVAPALAELGDTAMPSPPPPLMVGVRLRRGALGLRLFTTIATLGTPTDVTLQELRIETLYPADDDSKQTLLAQSPRMRAASGR